MNTRTAFGGRRNASSIICLLPRRYFSCCVARREHHGAEEPCTLFVKSFVNIFGNALLGMLQEGSGIKFAQKRGGKVRRYSGVVFFYDC